MVRLDEQPDGHFLVSDIGLGCQDADLMGVEASVVEETVPDETWPDWRRRWCVRRQAPEAAGMARGRACRPREMIPR